MRIIQKSNEIGAGKIGRSFKSHSILHCYQERGVTSTKVVRVAGFTISIT